MVASLGFGAPTGADQDVLSTLERVTARSTSSETDVLFGLVEGQILETNRGAVDALVGDTHVIVPNTSAEPVTLRSGTKGIDFYLPFSDKGSEARFEQNGVVSFDNQNGSTSVAVVKGDGNLQVLTIINNASAPSQYDYEIVLPDDGRIVETEDGTLIVLGAEDDFLGVALPPWAKDSNGKDVPTRYEVRGNVVTQVVDISQLRCCTQSLLTHFGV